MVEECHDVVVAVDDGRGDGAVDYLAEDIGHLASGLPIAPVRIKAESTWPPPIRSEPARTPTARRVAERLNDAVASSRWSTSRRMVSRSSASLPRMASVRR